MKKRSHIIQSITAYCNGKQIRKRNSLIVYYVIPGNCIEEIYEQPNPYNQNKIPAGFLNIIDDIIYSEIPDEINKKSKA